MSLSGKVAKLYSEGTHKGTAWLISPKHALTALHCVQDDADDEYSGLNLQFPNLSQHCKVHVVTKVRDLDIALLELEKIHEENLCILTLSRRMPAMNDKCLMYGYPGKLNSAMPDGIFIKGIVATTALPYRGVSNNLNCRALLVGDLSVTADQGSSNLQGLSGGPMTLEGGHESCPVIGVVIEEQLGGNFIVVITLKEIAEYIPEVKTALQEQSYVDKEDPRLFIKISESGDNVCWSAAVHPSQADSLWSVKGVPYIGHPAGIEQLYISVSLRQLGTPVSQALVRLCAYSQLTTAFVTDEQSWRLQVSKLSEHHRPPARDLNFSLYQPLANEYYPSKWINVPKETFADDLHRTLDIYLLERLCDRLYNCFNGGVEPDFWEDKINPKLRERMETLWEGWHQKFISDTILLQRYLVRVFSIDGRCEGHDGVLMSIGYTRQIEKQLLHATLYALALSAAGIDTSPQLLREGNIEIDHRTGHTCGIERSKNKRLDRIMDSYEWSTDVVILPFMQNQLMQTYEQAVSLTSIEGSRGYQLNNLPPLAITGDKDFLEALENGGDAVKKYYEIRRIKLGQIRDMQKLPTRTELLDA